MSGLFNWGLDQRRRSEEVRAIMGQAILMSYWLGRRKGKR